MKIAIGSLLLADTNDGSGASVFRMAPEIARAVQVVAAIRADSVRTRHRKNKQTSFSFSISRGHASPAAALYYLFVHESTIEPDAALVITPQGSTATITIAGNLKSVRSEITGSRSTCHYTFIGGTPVPAGFVLATETSDPLLDEDGHTLID